MNYIDVSLLGLPSSGYERFRLRMLQINQRRMTDLIQEAEGTMLFKNVQNENLHIAFRS